ncbi:hypothetical protein [uncultured Desulfuromonas sp.]|uniref:hypothetical protein n=1 Tax=uncultured Desulfuromonas sp. TaxID=181013 RepID=UPI002AAC19EA|nr:hypothetical protein [uncultured Desulfuromonas sp.]
MADELVVGVVADQAAGGQVGQPIGVVVAVGGGLVLGVGEGGEFSILSRMSLA